MSKVFIAYGHDDEIFADKMLDFTNELRLKRIDANIDQFEESPPEGWPRWMENQITTSDFVLVICTKPFYKKLYEHPTNGVSWEIGIIYQFLYNSGFQNSKYIPVVLCENDKEYIPIPLQGATSYNLMDKKQYERLCNRLKGETEKKKVPIHAIAPVPMKIRTTSYFNNFILKNLQITPVDINITLNDFKPIQSNKEKNKKE